MVRFEPESQEKIAGQKGRQEKKREGLAQQRNPGLAADTERPWVRLAEEVVMIETGTWCKQEKPSENYPRGTVLTS